MRQIVTISIDLIFENDGPRRSIRPGRSKHNQGPVAHILCRPGKSLG